MVTAQAPAQRPPATAPQPAVDPASKPAEERPRDWLPCGASVATYTFSEDCEITDDFLRELGEERPELLFEVSVRGDLVVTMAAGDRGSEIGSEFGRIVGNWTVEPGYGVTRESSGGYQFETPLGIAKRQPDVSWISSERYDALTPDERRRDYWPTVPEFVIEVVSPSDRLSQQREKMAEWMQGGVSVGWLVDPFEEEVHIYRPDAQTELHQRPAELEVGPELPGLTISFARIWAD